MMPSRTQYLAAFQTRLGHTFTQHELLTRALTHTTAITHTDDRRLSNERLEFLGDRVVGLVIADMLLKHFPDETEGEIARRFVAQVRKETLADVATELGIDTVLNLGSGIDPALARQPTVMADACEAILAAVYLDGGMEAAAHVIERHWQSRIETIIDPPKDAKTRLQEWAQRDGDAVLPSYQEVMRSGPSHAPQFTIRVEIAGIGTAEATGRSKRQAEQAAAETMLNELGVWKSPEKTDG